MLTTAINNSGHQLLCPADLLTKISCPDLSPADLFLNCFAVSKKTQSAENIDNTTLLDIRDINKTLEGDQQAFKRIVERHQKHISAMMWRFSRDNTTHEELVQDVFVQVYTSLHTFRQKAPFKHWIRRIATHVGFSYWKEIEKSKNTVSFEDFDQAKLSSENSKPAEIALLLHLLLEKLPPRDRLVLTLRYLQQYSIEETAELAGWSDSMVKVQTWRAKKKLRKLFEEYQILPR